MGNEKGWVRGWFGRMMTMKMTILEKITMMMLKMLLLAIAVYIDVDANVVVAACCCYYCTHNVKILGYKCQTHTLGI